MYYGDDYNERDDYPDDFNRGNEGNSDDDCKESESEDSIYDIYRVSVSERLI